jgi:hypothetical protein
MNKVFADFAVRWKALGKSQKISMLGMIVPLLILPLSLFLVMNSTNLQSRASAPGYAVILPDRNNVPVMLTKYLPLVSSGEYYSWRVEGYDVDIGDDLNFQFVNLPDGFSVDDCIKVRGEGVVEARGNSVSYISCNIVGVVEDVGLYEITVILTDSGGAHVSRVFNLQVE